jgi:cell division septum initiation protein DivIVA
MTDSSERKRIEQLEAEVNELKAALLAQKQSEHSSQDTPAAPAANKERPIVPVDQATEAELKALEAQYTKKRTGKAVLIGIGVVLASIGIIYIIYSALAKGLDNLAGKAARRFVPTEQQDPGVVRTAPVAPPVPAKKGGGGKAAPPEMNPPGL